MFEKKCGEIENLIPLEMKSRQQKSSTGPEPEPEPEPGCEFENNRDFDYPVSYTVFVLQYTVLSGFVKSRYRK